MASPQPWGRLLFYILFHMKYRKTGRYIYRNIAGEGVLVPVKDGICNLENLLLLNPTATAIWERIKDQDEFEQESLLGWIVSEYEVKTSSAEADLKTVLDELVSSRCLAECN